MKNATVAAVPIVVQGASDTYTATATYQRPVVTTIALNDISVESLDRHDEVPPAAALAPSQMAGLSRRQRPHGDANGADRSSDADHYYSEINSEAASSSSSSLSSSASAAAAGITMTSSSHVTQTDTPTKEANGADAATAVYSGLDTATMSEPTTPSLSVYQALNGRDRHLSSASS